jgi:hypothetical protein
MAGSSPENHTRKIEEEVREQLELLFADFYPGSPSFNMFARHGEQFEKKFRQSTNIIETFTETLQSIPTCEKIEELPKYRKAINVVNAFGYLAEVETTASIYVDLAVLILIAKGQDLHLGPDRKHMYTRHAMSLEDLESPTLPLSVKLDFLDLNGLFFFSKWIDRDLRNKIAHLDFDFDENGNLLLTNGERKEVKLEEKIASFMEYYNVMATVFAEELGKTMKRKES